VHHHPAYAEEIVWDDDNEGHFTQGNRVRPSEADEVLRNGPVYVRNRKQRAGTHKAIGLTDAGRAVTIVVQYDEESRQVRPITGWSATRDERTRHLKE
jgi:epoxyqueuosine reductase QueG